MSSTKERKVQGAADDAVLIIKLRGGLFIGGQVADGRRRLTLRDARGRPYIPASAVKGAVRAQYERLVDDQGEVERLFGCAGRNPRAETDAGGPAEPPGGGTARVYFTDAVPVDDAPFVRKPQVAVDRDTGTAVDERFFEREIVAPFSGLELRARVDVSGLSAEEKRRLRCVVRSTVSLGAGRSAGLGWVEMDLQERSGMPEADEAEREIPDSEAVDLWLEALDPLCFGLERQLGNFFPSRHFLPAKTLRGALVTAALRRRGIDRDLSDDPDFRRLVLEPETCIRFSDAYPVSCVDPQDPCPRPAPLTLWGCKADESHAWSDRLLTDFYLGLLDEAGARVVPERRCAECGGPRGGRMVRRSSVLHAGEPERRFATRLKMDRASGRGEEGKLFAVELLEKGTVFRTRARGLTDEGRRLLADGFRGPIRAGHGRGQGYGRLRLIRAEPVRGETDLRRRVTAFNDRARNDLERMSKSVEALSVWMNRQFLAFTLLSDAVARDPGDGRPLWRLFAEALETAGLPAGRCHFAHGAVRTGRQGGWDALKHRPKNLDPTLLAGSVLLMWTEEPLDELWEGLIRLEERGIGERTAEGFGALRVCDPLHAAGAPV